MVGALIAFAAGAIVAVLNGKLLKKTLNKDSGVKGLAWIYGLRQLINLAFLALTAFLGKRIYSDPTWCLLGAVIGLCSVSLIISFKLSLEVKKNG